jgi:hypothetical protein
MKANVTILYREIIGAGADDEAQDPNGVEVTLSYWRTETKDWHVPSFYMIESKVMRGRRGVVDNCEIERTSYRDDADMIRKAIELVDELSTMTASDEDEDQ